MTRLTLAGNTFSIRAELKAEGFRWNPIQKSWYKDFNEMDNAKRIMSDYEGNGVYGTLTATKETSKPKLYRVKESWIFNLESMHDKVWCLIYDMQEGKLKAPFKVAGKTINDESDLHELLEESSILQSAAWSGVTGAQYGRIKEIVAWRVEQRYMTCLANGMDESEAGGCFEDM